MAAVEAGADFIGLVFVPERPRRLDVSSARRIVTAVRKAAGRVPQVVGLFAGQPLDQVNEIIDSCGLDLAQLCGQEPPQYCRQVRARVIKVIHVDGSAAATEAVDCVAERAGRYRDAGHLVTLDRLVEGVPGGTGRSFDWDIAARLARRGLPFLLAGGLTPDNVSQAVAQVSPWGVDVSSGVETDGAKDHDKIPEFINNARSDPS